MVVRFFSWWFSRLAELIPVGWTRKAGCLSGSIMIDMRNDGEVAALVRGRNGYDRVVSLIDAAGLAARTVVVLRPPADKVLQKRHTVPTAPRRQLGQLLRHELARITPFAADALFWRWDAHARPGYQRNTTVTLTMVPKSVLLPAFAKLRDAGIRVDALLTGDILLPINNDDGGNAGAALVRGLSWACVGLAVVAMTFPLGLQALARHQTDNAIADLRPAVAEVEAIQSKVAEAQINQQILRRQTDRADDVVRVLATVTRALPDDTFLTDLTLRERQVTFSGRSGSAARLVTILSADPAIRAVAFSAPVVRVEGAARDIFSIQAEMTEP